MFLVLLFFGPFVPFLVVSDPFLIQKHLFLAFFGRELEKIFHGYVSDGQERGRGSYIVMDQFDKVVFDGFSNTDIHNVKVFFSKTLIETTWLHPCSSLPVAMSCLSSQEMAPPSSTVKKEVSFLSAPIREGCKKLPF